MSTELSIVEQNPLAEIENTNKIYQMLMKLPHYAKMGAENVFAVVAKAKSLKIDPLYALNGALYPVKGKVGMGAETMAAMIRQKGHSITKGRESTDTCIVLHGRRKDNGDTWSVKYSLDDAKRAGIHKDNYDKMPGIMIYNRAMSLLARQLFPDIIMGAGYTPDEIDEIARNMPPVTEAVPTEIVEEKISPVQADELMDILLACDPAYNEKIWKTFRSNEMKMEKINDLPLKLYDRVKTAATKNRDEYQAAQVKPTVQQEVPRSMDELAQSMEAA